jgi:hypothetical protein
MASDNHPTGYIVSNADDLLGLFDADFGVLVVCGFVPPTARGSFY